MDKFESEHIIPDTSTVELYGLPGSLAPGVSLVGLVMSRRSMAALNDQSVSQKAADS
jgi:hypothetical protein